MDENDDEERAKQGNGCSLHLILFGVSKWHFVCCVLSLSVVSKSVNHSAEKNPNTIEMANVLALVSWCSRHYHKKFKNIRVLRMTQLQDIINNMN